MNWTEIETKLKSIQTETNCRDYKDATTTAIPRTYVLGNGDMGVVSDGSAGSKDYILTKGDFWNCGDLHTNSVMLYHKNRVSSLAVGRLSISGKALESPIKEHIELVSGTLISEYEDIQLSAIVTSNDNYLIIKMTAEVSVSLKATLSLPLIHTSDFPNGVAESGGIKYLYRKSINNAKKNPMSWTSEVNFAGRIVGGDNNWTENNNSLSIDIKLNAGEERILAVALSGGGKVYDNQDKLIAKLPSQALISNIDKLRDNVGELLNSHTKWWREFWGRSYIDIDDTLLERYYYGSLYLTGAGSRAGKLPPGIMGIWTTTDNPKWNNDYHMNYNYIAPFYGSFSSNHAEFARDLLGPIVDFIPEATRRAKADSGKVMPKYTNAHFTHGKWVKARKDIKNGIDNAVLFPVAVAPYGVISWEDKNGGYLSQMNNAAFTAIGLTMYYFYTLSRDYFNTIYEFLVKITNYFMVWREREETPDGYRYNLVSGAHENSCELNAVGVVASIRNVLKCLLDGVNRGYVPKSQELAKWQDFYDNLAKYPITSYKSGKFNAEIVPLGEKGLIVTKDEAPVNLEFIFPAEEVDFMTDERMLKACRNTIDLKIALNSDIWRQINNLPKMFAQAIRVGYSAGKVMENLRSLLTLDLMANYTVKDYNDTHGIEKAGGIEAINSMLLQSSGFIMEVFPNWICGKPAKFYHLKAKGNYTVTSEYDGVNIVFIKLISHVLDTVSLIKPFENVVIKNEKGDKVLFTEATLHGRSIITFNVKVGEEYDVNKT